jgi:hypothetical protein
LTGIISNEYNIHIYENKIIKPVNIVIKGMKEEERFIKGMNLIKVHYMNVWKYHNAAFVYN